MNGMYVYVEGGIEAIQKWKKSIKILCRKCLGSYAEAFSGHYLSLVMKICITIIT